MKKIIRPILIALLIASVCIVALAGNAFATGPIFPSRGNHWLDWGGSSGITGSDGDAFDGNLATGVTVSDPGGNTRAGFEWDSVPAGNWVLVANYTLSGSCAVGCPLNWGPTTGSLTLGASNWDSGGSPFYMNGAYWSIYSFTLGSTSSWIAFFDHGAGSNSQMLWSEVMLCPDAGGGTPDCSTPTATPTATATSAPTNTPTITPTGTPAPATTTYAFNTVADTWLSENNPTTIYGHSSSEMILGDVATSGVKVGRGAVRFNIGLVPANAQILSATLRLTTADDSGGSGPRDIDVYKLKEGWTEDSANWTDRQIEFNSALNLNELKNWTTTGAGSGSRNEPASATASVDGAGTYSWDVTEDVRGWVSADNLNFGWVLEDRSVTDNVYRSFRTREYGSSPPELQIQFIPAPHVDNSWLQDGSFEDNSPAWNFNAPAPGTGRINANVNSANNVGPAACGDWYSVIDGGTFDGNTGQPNALIQRFYWPGGTAWFHMYYRRNTNDNTASQLIAQLDNIDGSFTTYLANPTSYNSNTDSWLMINATPVYLQPGNYDLRFGADGVSNNIGDWAIDDVTISLNSYMSYCSGLGGPTRTPFPQPTATLGSPTASITAGPSPTPTNTPSVSPTPTVSPTPASNSIGNCNFESNLTAWVGNSVSLSLAGGPIGPRYAIVAGRLYQTFSWAGGVAYVTFWAGPNSYGSVAVFNVGTNTRTTLATIAGPSAWGLHTVAINLTAGAYNLEINGLGSQSPFLADGVLVSANGYKYCGANGNSNTVITPTSGPTSFISPTASNTPNTTWTAVPSATATRTATRPPSATPYPTGTPGATYTQQATSTLPATSTSAPSATQPSANQTATAQGTSIPTYTPAATYTPYPTYTPPPFNQGPQTDCPTCQVPPQPPNGPDADCKRPTYFWEVAQWIDYTRCDVLAFFSWSTGNTQQLQDFTTQVQSYEPFGTVSEFQEAVQAAGALFQSYDWVNTGYVSVYAISRPSITALAQNALGGNVNLTPDPVFMNLYNTEWTFCDQHMVSVFSTNVANGMCVVWTFLHVTGLREWIQFFWDLAAWALFARYCWYYVKWLFR